MKLHGVACPETQLFSLRQQPRQWPVQRSALSQAPGELSPHQRRSGAGTPMRRWPGWGSSATERSVDTSRALLRPRLGNCMVQILLSRADRKSQQYPNLAKGDA